MTARSEPTVILMYHRVAMDEHDPFRLSVQPDNVIAQLKRVRARAEIVPLAEVRKRGAVPRVALTFDDGYADNLGTALEILRTAGAPATVFVTSGMIDSALPMWPMQLDRLFRLGQPRTRHLQIEVGRSRLTVDVGSASARHRAMHAVHERLRRRPPEEVDEVLGTLTDLLGMPRADSSRRMLTTAELRELAANDLITIGAHTRRHPWLASLSAAEQEREIAGSRLELAELTGGTIDQFAYPYGYRASFDRASVRAVRRAGFALACTTLPGGVVGTDSRFRLPRFGVVDCDDEEFDTKLREWLTW